MILHDKKSFIATQICIGHMDLMIKYPIGKDKVIYQTTRDFMANGKPKDIHYGLPQINTPKAFDPSKMPNQPNQSDIINPLEKI
jgi:hypothetical protein